MNTPLPPSPLELPRSKKARRWFRLLAQAAKVLFVILLVFFLSWQINLDRGTARLGFSWSAPYAEWLGLDARAAYTAALDELHPKAVRLITYWNRIEPGGPTPDWSELDSQVKEAEARHVPLILAIGNRTPRWPECHTPEWAAALLQKGFENALLQYLSEIVNRYKDSPAVTMWQVENEPFLGSFGECPPSDLTLFKREVALVTNLDPSRPILVTDSGELSVFPRGAGVSAAFGTTLYRVIWEKHTGSFTYYYPPALYSLRAFLTTRFSSTKQVIIAELQGEPWATSGGGLIAEPLDIQTKYFGIKELEENVGFAKATGIRDIYLWGAEWWYYRKMHGDPSFWNTAKKLTEKAT